MPAQRCTGSVMATSGSSSPPPQAPSSSANNAPVNLHVLCAIVVLFPASILGAGPEIRLRIVVFEEIDPQPHTQGQVLALRKHGKNAVRGRGKRIQNSHQPAGGDVGLDLPGTAPRDAPAGQAPLVQHLSIRAVQRST